MHKFFDMDGLFARVMNRLWEFILISLLWIVCSIPLITAGAATTAAYYAMAKVVRHHTGKIFPEFFKSFRANFKQSFGFTVLYAMLLVFLVLDCAYFFGNEAQGSLMLLYLFYFMILMVIAHGAYLFPFLSRFQMTGFQLFRMAAIAMFRHLISTILLLLLLAALLLGIYLMPWGLLVFPGAVIYVQSFLMERILRKYTPTPEEGSEEAQKWFYQ